jgi:cytoskeletal protein RodZ
MKLIVGTSVILLVTVLLLTIQYFNNRRANSSIPVGAADSVSNKPADHITPTAASTSQSPDTTTTAPVKETPSKTTAAENVQPKKKNETKNNRQEKRDQEKQQTTSSNEKSIVTISTSRPCSLKIVSAANGYNEFVPSLQDNVQIPLQPGKYIVTAVNLRNRSETCTGFLTVNQGRNIRFLIPWQ